MDAIETMTIEQNGQTSTASLSMPDEDAANPLEDRSEMGTVP